MKIKNMRKVNAGKVKAFFSIDTKNFTINDMKLVEGDKGIFVAFPSREYLDQKTQQKKYVPIIWCKDTDFIKAINEEALRVYNSTSQHGPDDDVPF